MTKALSITDLAITVIEPSSTQWRFIQKQFEEMGVTRTECFKNGCYRIDAGETKRSVAGYGE